MSDTLNRITSLLKRVWPLAALALIVGLWIAQRGAGIEPAYALGNAIVGRVLDEQGSAVLDAAVMLTINGREGEPLAEVETKTDGSFVLLLPQGEAIRSAHIEITRHHFRPYAWDAEGDALRLLREQGSLILDDIVLARSYTAGFWIATAVFIGMLVIIALERMHNTLAALLAVAVIFSITFVGGRFSEALYIIDFEHALAHIDFEVIFLLMGMMIIIGIIEETGIFQWLAYRAYLLSRGKLWLMTIILMLIAAVVTALLDNVTTVLLLTPITIEIALALGANPLALLFPMLMASNVGGIATLIGTPTNILIGSYAGLGFNDFLVNLTPGVLLAEAGLIGFMLLWFRKEHHEMGSGISPALRKRLEDNAKIRDINELRTALIVLGALLALFIFGESFHLTPAVSAVIGAVAMLLLVNPNIEAMLGVVDWTTLVFFMGLFMVVGAVNEVGLIGVIATAIGSVVGDSLAATMMVLVWSASLLSGVVDNIPFTAAMLPAVDYLTRTVPGAAARDALYYALAVGTATGGNFTLIASSSNVVVAGIAERAGYRISFLQFLKIGAAATAITAVLGSAWLLLHFL